MYKRYQHSISSKCQKRRIRQTMSTEFEATWHRERRWRGTSEEAQRQQYAKLAEEAAEWGRLTRLKEYVVETTAEPKAKKEWKSVGLLAIQGRKDHLDIVRDAARVGAATRLPEKIFGNVTEDEAEETLSTMSPQPLKTLAQNRRVGAR